MPKKPTEKGPSETLKWMEAIRKMGGESRAKELERRAFAKVVINEIQQHPAGDRPAILIQALDEGVLNTNEFFEELRAAVGPMPEDDDVAMAESTISDASKIAEQLGTPLEIRSAGETQIKGLLVPLNKEELYVIWAAMCSMVLNNHSPQDNLTEEQGKLAEDLHARFSKYVNDNFSRHE